MFFVLKCSQLHCWSREFSQEIFDHLRYCWIIQFADRFDFNNEKRQVLANKLARSIQVTSFDETGRPNRMCHRNLGSIEMFDPMVEWWFSTDIKQCHFEPTAKTSTFTVAKTNLYRDEGRIGTFMVHTDFHNHWWPIDRCSKDRRLDTIIGTGTQLIQLIGDSNDWPN